jgi:hypothetical protein
MLVYPGYIPPFSLPGFSTGTYGIAQLRDTPTKIPDLPLLIPTRLRPLFYTPHSSLTMSAGMDYIVIAYSVKEVVRRTHSTTQPITDSRLRM